LFSLFIIYGTLIPFHLNLNLETVRANFSAFSKTPFIDPDGSRASLPDVIQNILLFIPFGFLGRIAENSKKKLNSILKITLWGALLSACVEALQLLTTDRTTSITDWVTNAIGTLLGIIIAIFLADLFAKVSALQWCKNLTQDKYFTLTLMALALVSIGSLQPFDLTLDRGIVGSKIIDLINHPINFPTLVKDEGVVFIRVFLLAYVCSIWLKSIYRSMYPVIAFLLCSTVGLFLEATQIFVQSRMPGLQDAAVIVLACFFGALTAVFKLNGLRPFVWVGLFCLGTALSAGLYALSPFVFQGSSGSFNWMPFLADYQNTSFVVLSNFIDTLLIYLPLGFFLKHVYAQNKGISIFLYIGIWVAIVSSVLEYLQFWVPGRYADITDILGAISGATLGALICNYWHNKHFPPAPLAGQ